MPWVIIENSDMPPMPATMLIGMNTTPNTVIPGGIYADRVDQLPAQLQPLVATYSTPFKEDLYFGKIDWTLGDNNLFELTGKYRKKDELSDIGDTTTDFVAIFNAALV